MRGFLWVFGSACSPLVVELRYSLCDPMLRDFLPDALQSYSETIGRMQRILGWPLRKDDTHREEWHNWKLRGSALVGQAQTRVLVTPWPLAILVATPWASATPLGLRFGRTRRLWRRGFAPYGELSHGFLRCNGLRRPVALAPCEAMQWATTLTPGGGSELMGFGDCRGVGPHC